MALVPYSLSDDEEDSPDSEAYPNDVLLPDKVRHKYHDFFDFPQGAPRDWCFDAGSHDMLGGNLPDLEHFYILKEGREGYSKRFKISTNEFSLTFRNMDGADDFDDILERVFDKAIGKFRFQGEGLMGAEIYHPEMNSSFQIQFRPFKAFKGSFIMHQIQKLLQSNKDITIDSAFQVTLVQIPFPSGSRDKKRKYRNSFDQWKAAHSGRSGAFIKIKNDDNLCCARAIVVAKAKIQKDPKWDLIRKNESSRHFIQRNRALELMIQAGLSHHKGPCGIPELEKFQAVLAPDYQIKVFTRNDSANLIYKGPAAKLRLCLFLHDNHYDVVTSVPAIHDSGYYCHECDTPYNNASIHNCSAICSSCRSPGICHGNPQYCPECNRTFLGMECYRKHKETTNAPRATKKQKLESNLCKRLKRCLDCGVQYRNTLRHECGVSYCTVCQTNVKWEGHKCYMTKAKPRKNPSYKSLIFFDFETEQERTAIVDTDDARIYDHRVIACIAQKICVDCRYNPLGNCSKCGPNEVRFSGKNTLDDFCQWLFSDRNFDSLALAHNSQGFDSQFILQYLYKQGVEPTILGRGRNILSLQANSIKIIDSLSFLPMPLSAIPKAFGIKEFKKGFFPHFFTSLENREYVGHFPDMSFYDPGSMKPKQREEFLKWYDENKDREFVMKKELFEYCQSDVNILREGIIRFQDTFKQETGIDPLDGNITIAQACQTVFRTNFMQKDTIGLIPFDGYRRKDKYSQTAIKWLKWISHNQGINIQHARNGGEVKIGPYKVDGFHDSTVYEFNGCPFHGCPKCYPDQEKRLPLSSEMTAGCAYQRTLERKEFIKRSGYEVIEMWSCELNQELKVNQDMKEFFHNLKFVEPMKPRDALYGGRTNATVLYHKTKKGEKIHYVDVCSLYPWVCKCGIFPVGHPQIITENFKPLDKKPYTGLIHCKVLPPKKLLHPVLPVRNDDKLCFPLCRSCLEQRNKKDCNHKDADRTITGTWVTLEFYKALEMGYTVQEVYEVYHFEHTKKYDFTNQNSGLFVEYINTFLKMKTEASGYPKWVKTEDDKLKFICNYEKREGIKLDPSKIIRNESLRNIAKLMLNSFWGKFAQNENLGNTVSFKNRDDFLKCVSDPSHVISEVRVTGPNLVTVKYSKDEEFLGISPNKNVIIAAFVTAQARLKLYTYLEPLQERVMYMDTDSIIYLTRPSDSFDLETGCYLGDLTNELEDYGSRAYISEFCSAGPKNYGFHAIDPETGLSHSVLKVKGISLTSDVSKEINFQNLKRKVDVFVKSGQQNKNSVIIRKFVRDPDHNVKTVYSRKTYQVVYDKRRVLPDFTTVPYGYIE